MTLVTELRQRVVEGRAGDVEALVRQGLAAGLSPDALLHEGLIAGIGEVGRRFECGEFYVPEMLIATRAVKAGLALLRPRLVEASVPVLGTVAIGTVEGDLHDIGKNLVATMLEGAGFGVTDLGVNVPAARFVEAARQGVNVLGISALLTTTMTRIPGIIQALREAGVRDRVRVVVGGAQVTEAFAADVGADGYGADASRAVAVARFLVAPG